MQNKLSELLEILNDQSAREDERHDAAMCLFEFDEPEVVQAFFSIGADAKAPTILQEAAGEGIGEIWSRHNQFNLRKLETLTRLARDVALSIIKIKNPKLLMKQ